MLRLELGNIGQANYVTLNQLIQASLVGARKKNQISIIRPKSKIQKTLQTLNKQIGDLPNPL